MELTLTIRKPLIRDFLAFLFEMDASGRYIITRKIPAGQLLCSLVEYSYKPVPEKGNVKIVLPGCSGLKTAETRFIYLSAESQAKVNDFLEATFDTDFDRYWIQGLKMGIAQKDIIYAYMVSRKLFLFDQDPETLKKRIYRNSKRQIQSIYKQLLNKASYNDRVISNQLRSEFFTH